MAFCVSKSKISYAFDISCMKHATLGPSSRHLFKRLRLDEPWHGNVLLSCGPHKLEPKQQLQEFNADFVPRLRYLEGTL